MGALGEVLGAFLKLGLSSFGGPVAHLGYFEAEFVQRRRWIKAEAYAELVALCQFLPGPASSQVGMALGYQRAGLPGLLSAWAAFTLPSCLFLLALALGLSQPGQGPAAPWVHGVLVAAVAVVAQAIWNLGRQLTPDFLRLAIACAGAGLCLLWPHAWVQIAVLLLGALLGQAILRPERAQATGLGIAVPAALSWACLGLFAALLLLLPLGASFGWAGWDLANTYYRAGALVFGGGHVVLPLLKTGLVGKGWLSAPSFLAGYGAAQAVPGPLFSVAAYWGAVGQVWPNGLGGAALATVAVFLPAALILLAALPHWQRLGRHQGLRGAMAGMNAAVVGLLLAAFVDPVWSEGVHGLLDGLVALLGFFLLGRRFPAWLWVGLCALLFR
jgi:chromate transporter